MVESSSCLWWRYLGQDKIIYGIKIPSFSSFLFPKENAVFACLLPHKDVIRETCAKGFTVLLSLKKEA